MLIKGEITRLLKCGDTMNVWFKSDDFTGVIIVQNEKDYQHVEIKLDKA
jgi:hypothetical protein